MLKKKSFFERLAGSIRMKDDEENVFDDENSTELVRGKSAGRKGDTDSSSEWVVEEEQEGELTIDVYQTAHDIVVQSMIAGVSPDNLSITITRDLITIKGKREKPRGVTEEDYFIRELYWGSFSRTISLPQEVEADEAEAIEKHGLLIIKMPKIDRGKQTVLKVKSS